MLSKPRNILFKSDLTDLSSRTMALKPARKMLLKIDKNDVSPLKKN